MFSACLPTLHFVTAAGFTVAIPEHPTRLRCSKIAHAFDVSVGRTYVRSGVTL